jgi:hypothetical protein
MDNNKFVAIAPAQEPGFFISEKEITFTLKAILHHSSTLYPMGQLLTNTLNRIAERSQFQNAELKALLTGYAQKSFALATANVEVEQICEDLGIDAVAKVNALDKLSQQFGAAFPTITPDAKAAIKAAVIELVDEENSELETALENYFSAELDMETTYNETSAGVNALVPAGDGG